MSKQYKIASHAKPLRPLIFYINVTLKTPQIAIKIDPKCLILYMQLRQTHSPNRSNTLMATKIRNPSKDTRSQTAEFQHLHSLSTTRWARMAA